MKKTSQSSVPSQKDSPSNSQSPTRAKPALLRAASPTITFSKNTDCIHVEDYDEALDGRFIRDFLTPYLRDVYRDLSLRSLSPQAIKDKKVDKVTFIQYCALPGIISERLLKIVDPQNDGLITEQAFISQITKIFVSDLEARMRFTFHM